MDHIKRTKAESKALHLTQYFTGAGCPAGHFAPRYVKGGQCVECQRDRARKYRGDNRSDAFLADNKAGTLRALIRMLTEYLAEAEAKNPRVNLGTFSRFLNAFLALQKSTFHLDKGAPQVPQPQVRTIWPPYIPAVPIPDPTLALREHADIAGPLDPTPPAAPGPAGPLDPDQVARDLAALGA